MFSDYRMRSLTIGALVVGHAAEGAGDRMCSLTIECVHILALVVGHGVEGAGCRN